jgi:asparagine synthase (glutamine-hydrolysing)
MKIIVDENYRWKSIVLRDYSIHYIGFSKDILPSIEAIVQLGENLQIDLINSILNNLNTPAAVIMESKNHIIAFTDHLCCYPIFYTLKGRGIISNSARNIIKSANITEWDALSVEEFPMTGYVTGKDTLFQDLKQMQSGECIMANLSNNEIDIFRYYRYMPSQEHGKSDEDWINELDSVMNKITQRMVERANGKPIYVPLSAGLDSRVIACKLHESGYNNLKVFSYGPPKNWESRGAHIIANKLDLPWFSAEISRKEAHQMFWSPSRLEYWSFSDGLSALPNFQEYFPISKLHNLNMLPEDVILINGQTGDFISGGHIPKILTKSDSDVSTLLACIISKHYALWKNLMTPDRLKRVEEKILGLLGVSIDTHLTNEDLISLYERWEFEERQSKWVIHGQRIYDFYGYDWQLPLWDIDLVHFFEKVPISLKIDQRLYHLWLDRWNYKNLFRDFNPPVWNWSGPTLAVLPMAKVIEIVLGENAKHKWYELFYYWGDDKDHFAPYTYYEYLQTRSMIRNSTSLNIRVWARENGLPEEMMGI